MPLPTTEIQAFGPPTVKDGVLSQPVHTNDGLRVMTAPASRFREMAWEILAITAAKGRPRPQLGRAPLLNPARPS